MTTGIIVGMTPDFVIGRDNSIPWHHPADMKRFKQLTSVEGSIVIMGRLTWQSLPKRPLPGRRNIVITTTAAIEGVECYPSVSNALAAVGDAGPVWFIGGARLYEEAMKHADFVDVTWVLENIEPENCVLFPKIDPDAFEPGVLWFNPDDTALRHQRFTRRVAVAT